MDAAEAISVPCYTPAASVDSENEDGAVICPNCGGHKDDNLDVISDEENYQVSHFEISRGFLGIHMKT